METPSLSFRHAGARNGIVVPGVPSLPIGMERYWLSGGNLRVLPIHAGDRIYIDNVEGLQPCHLVIFDTKGHSRVEMMGCGENEAISTEPIMQMMDQAMHEDDTAGGIGSGAARVKRALDLAGIDLAHAQALSVFPSDVPMGAKRCMTSEVEGMILLALPASAMRPETSDTSTTVILDIQRTEFSLDHDAITLPVPLADPIQEHHILPGCAVAYEVKAGQYIQVIDIQGRECSDFQAFSLKALEHGFESEIDPTTTRSMGGSLYPAPGLYAKYFNVAQDPLIEIVQDTCGRHDTFGLACTARYYEDMGYPGHVNCTDNINKVLQSWNVKPRRGWHAINFFFNTLLDARYALLMDDPWSRPGDYVLLRALSDLVCVSTACPCDVDPANAWNPTDIQLRVYEKTMNAKRSIAWRKTTEAPLQHTQETGFHACFARYTRNFVEYNGYWLASDTHTYGTIAEYWACREKAAIMDLSPLRKYEVTGPDAETLLQYCVTRNIKKLAVGQVVYTAMCYEHGGMIDDGTVMRLADNNFRWVGGNDQSGIWLREQLEKQKLNAWVRCSTDQLANVAVQGPRSREILAQIFWTAPTQPTIDELGWFRFCVARVNDIHGIACVISRTGYTGELGYEIFCHPKDATQVFEALMQAGQPYGLIPLGLNALDMLRIEAGLAFAGQEFNDQTDPLEAGIGFTVPLKTKEDCFIGKEALIRRKQHPARVLVGLDIEGGIIPLSGDCLRMGRAQVGEITSAVKSPILGKVIALARIDVQHAELGTNIEIGQLDGQQKRIKATVCPFPHFDPTKERVKGNSIHPQRI